MTKRAIAVSIEERTEELRKAHGNSVPVDDIGSVVLSLVQGADRENDRGDVATELRELLEYIGAAKSELIDMQPNSLSHRDIPNASEQLTAIISATEGAASTIMDAADSVGEIAEQLDGDVSEKLEAISTELFQASSFQDLTGQRITKVTRTLDQLEQRLSSLASAIGDDYIAPEVELDVDEQGVAVNSNDLLHGPQLEGEGNSQDDIDAILAAFD